MLELELALEVALAALALALALALASTLAAPGSLTGLPDDEPLSVPELVWSRRALILFAHVRTVAWILSLCEELLH